MSPGSTTVLCGALPTRLKLTSDEKRALKNFAVTLAEHVAAGRAFTCLITNDEQLRHLNSSFLGHDYATDVLSFPALSVNGNLGDIAISVERAEVQAAEFGHSRIDELRILMLHGLLHLSGLDHEDDGGEMAAVERKWREEFGLPLNLIARTARSRLHQ